MKAVPATAVKLSDPQPEHTTKSKPRNTNQSNSHPYSTPNRPPPLPRKPAPASKFQQRQLCPQPSYPRPRNTPPTRLSTLLKKPNTVVKAQPVSALQCHFSKLRARGSSSAIVRPSIGGGVAMERQGAVRVNVYGSPLVRATQCALKRKNSTHQHHIKANNESLVFELDASVDEVMAALFPHPKRRHVENTPSLVNTSSLDRTSEEDENPTTPEVKSNPSQTATAMVMIDKDQQQQTFLALESSLSAIQSDMSSLLQDEPVDR